VDTIHVVDIARHRVYGNNEKGMQAFAQIMGQTIEQSPIYFMIPYNPYVYVNLPYEWTEQECRNWVKSLETQFRSDWYQSRQLLYRNRQRIHTLLCHKMCTVIKFAFRTIADTKMFCKKLIELPITNTLGKLSERIWETPKVVPDSLKVSMMSDIRPSTWITVPVDKCRSLVTTFTRHCDEWIVSTLNDFKLLPDPAPKPFPSIARKVISFDLECFTDSDRFTNAKQGDPIIVIGNCLMTIRDGKCVSKRHLLFCLDDFKRDPNDPYKDLDPTTILEVFCFKTERDMLLSWKRMIFDELDPDIITGWNIYLFDLPYIWDRAKMLLGPQDDDFYAFGRLLGDKTVFKSTGETAHSRAPQQDQKTLDHSWNGGRVLATTAEPVKKKKKKKDFKKIVTSPVQMFGRVVLDMMQWMKTQQSLQLKSYKLDTVSETLLGLHKTDMPIREMFAKYKQGPIARYKILIYCNWDCELVLLIMLHQNTCARELAMSQHTCTNMETVVSCGQQLKCFNLMMWYGHRRRYVCNYTAPKKSVESWVNYHEWSTSNGDNDVDEDKFKGATVLNPVTGFYQKPVIVVDFQAKYPTEMMSHNLCSSTFLGDESKTLQFEPWLKEVLPVDWGSSDPIQFDDTTQFRTFWQIRQDKRFVNPMDEWHECRPHIQKVINGPGKWSYFDTSSKALVAEVIAFLFSERVKLKKAMKQAKLDGNSLAEALANADQMAIKVIMNSLYGLMGADPETGRLPCRNVAMSVTSIGREEIDICKRVAELKFLLQVIYGDTDSLFLSEKKFTPSVSQSDDIRRAFEIGESFANYITNVAFNKKAVLNLEKVFLPFVMPENRKKQYVGAKFEPEKDKTGAFVVGKPKQHGTGTLANKIDFCDVHKKTFRTLFEHMIMDNDVHKAYRYLVYSIERIANMWYPIEQFACRMKLSQKGCTKAAAVRDRIQKRLPGQEPKSGDIVSFVYLRMPYRGPNDKTKVTETVEDMDYAKQMELVLDLEHYISLLRTQLVPYFVNFPSLKIDELFEHATSLAQQHGTRGFLSLFNNPAPNRFAQFLQQILVIHLRDQLHLPVDQVEIILTAWVTHFVWLPIPDLFHRPKVTNTLLTAESEQYLSAFATRPNKIDKSTQAKKRKRT
jgi:DNA polymerase delta subunit 1